MTAKRVVNDSGSTVKRMVLDLRIKSLNDQIEAKDRRIAELELELNIGCIGYPDCDGDLVCIAHSELCPLYGKGYTTK